MGEIFDAFPVFPRLPERRYTVRILNGKLIVTACITATAYGLCPKNEHPHAHPTHGDHTPMSRVLASAVMGSTSVV